MGCQVNICLKLRDWMLLDAKETAELWLLFDESRELERGRD